MGAYQDGKISASELQLTRFSHWAKRLGRTPFELNSAFMTAMADICEPLPGAAELLDSLKGRARLGIITNGFTELQQVRLQKTGFAEHFDLLVISEEVAWPSRIRVSSSMRWPRCSNPSVSGY